MEHNEFMKSYYTAIDVVFYAISSSILSCSVLLILLYRYQFVAKTRRVVSGEGGSHSTAVIVPSGYKTILQDVYGSEYTTKNASRGSISLVGAGPGNPNLLTLQAYHLLLTADVVISDRLICQDILRLIPSSTKVHIAKKLPGRQHPAQEELNSWALEALAQRKRVVRLKIGDPNVFGRGGEEASFYRSCGYEPLVVPGISSAMAAPTAAGIPLTLRGVADQVVFATGQGKDYTVPDIPRYRANTTVVLLMAVERIKSFEADLTQAGYPPTVPVAIIENATTSKERVTHGTVQSISALALAIHVKPPAIIVVGFVVSAGLESHRHSEPN